MGLDSDTTRSNNSGQSKPKWCVNLSTNILGDGSSANFIGWKQMWFESSATSSDGRRFGAGGTMGKVGLLNTL